METSEDTSVYIIIGVVVAIALCTFVAIVIHNYRHQSRSQSTSPAQPIETSDNLDIAREPVSDHSYQGLYQEITTDEGANGRVEADNANEDKNLYDDVADVSSANAKQQLTRQEKVEGPVYENARK